MLNIPLQAVPNQTFSIQLDENNYNIRIHDCGGDIMSVSVSIDNVVIIEGVRAVNGTPIIPYTYLENGNFAFLTMNDEYPHWSRFAVDQFLFYASQDEIDAIRAAPPSGNLHVHPSA